MGSPRRHIPIVAAAAVLLTAGLLAGCGPAHGTVKVENRSAPGSGNVAHLVFTAAPGKDNDVFVEPFGADLLIHDEADNITPGPGCTALDANTARCTGVQAMTMNLGDGNDVASNNTSVASRSLSSVPGIQGGPGDDVLNGGTSVDRLVGDEGDDTLNGLGESDDLVEGWTQAAIDEVDVDTFNGGPGVDSAFYAFPNSAAAQGVTVSLDDVANDGQPGEGDNVKADVENVAGGAGHDTLRGDADGNFLGGGAGNDVLTGFEGNDSLQGGSGNDIMNEGLNQSDVDAVDADTFTGDDPSGTPGEDRVSYAGGDASVRVDLDWVADDGRQAPLEGDNVRGDIENVTGGNGNDSLFGDADANRLIGNAGVDVLSGDASNDFLRGNAGVDSLNGGSGDQDDCDVGADGGSEFNCEI
jgi:Ca2+-binding RTX toxin-like protein